MENRAVKPVTVPEKTTNYMQCKIGDLRTLLTSTVLKDDGTKPRLLAKLLILELKLERVTDIKDLITSTESLFKKNKSELDSMVVELGDSVPKRFKIDVIAQIVLLQRPAPAATIESVSGSVYHGTINGSMASLNNGVNRLHLDMSHSDSSVRPDMSRNYSITTHGQVIFNGIGSSGSWSGPSTATTSPILAWRPVEWGPKNSSAATNSRNSVHIGPLELLFTYPTAEKEASITEPTQHEEST